MMRLVSINNYATDALPWIPRHHGMARPQVADRGDGLQICRVAANILKQSRTTDGGVALQLRGWAGD
jgi:hypothetical protein